MAKANPNSKNAILKSIFTLYCNTFGLKIATKHADPGGHFLDYNATYGGYVIAQYVRGSGGTYSAESHPLGDTRRPVGAMTDVLRFAIRSAQSAKRV